MANPYSFTKNVGTATSSNSTTIAVTVPASGVAIGQLLVASVGRSNAGDGTPSIADTKGNTWVNIKTSTTDDPVINIWISKITVALVSGNTITATFSAMAGRTMEVDEFAGAPSATEDTADQTSSASTTSPSVGPWTPGTLCLVYGANYHQANATFTGDGDNTGGDTWHTPVTPFANNGATAKHACQYKIPTDLSAQTFNPTWSGAASNDTIVICGVLGNAAGRQPRNPAINYTTTAVLCKAHDLARKWRRHGNGIFLPDHVTTTAVL